MKKLFVGLRLDKYLLQLRIFFAFFTSLIFCAALATLFSCGKHDDPGVCVPSSIGNAYTYNYDASFRLTEIDAVGTIPAGQFQMTYANGKLTTMTVYSPSYVMPTVVEATYILSYGADGLPAYRLDYDGPVSASPVDSVHYTYDSQNRLTGRAFYISHIFIYSTRYEYGANNNVSKIWCARSTAGQETLGTEYTSYDNHRRFYAGSADLTTVEQYMFDYDPSVNNVLQGTVYQTAGVSYYTFLPGLAMQPTYTYDSKGYVEAIANVNGLIPWFTFTGMNYVCH